MRASVDTLRNDARKWIGKLGWPELGALILTATAAFAYHRIADSPGSGSGTEAVEAFFFSPTATSPGLILGLATWLIFRRRGSLSDAMLSPSSPLSSGLSLVIMGAASGLCVWAHYVEALELMVPSMSMMLWGASFWLGGWSGASAMLTPCLFILLAFPPPAALLNSVIHPMQLMTASNTASLLQLAGIPASHLGELVFREGNTFYVIESCAGVRSTATLIMAAVIYIELLPLHRGRALCVMLVSPLIGIGVNHLRVLWITVFPSSDLADVHTHQGIIMLVIGVVLLALVDVVLEKLLPERFQLRSSEASMPKNPNSRQPPLQRPVVLVCLLLALGITTSTLPAWSAKRVGTTSISAVSPKLDGQWRADGLPLDQQFLGSVRFSEWMNRKYSKGDIQLNVFVGSNNRLDPSESLISRKNEFPGPGYQTVDRQTIEIEPAGLEVNRRMLRGKGHRVLSLQWYLGVEGRPTEFVRSTFALDRGPWRRPGRAMTARVSMQLSRDQAEWPEQEASLKEVARLVSQELARIEKS